MERVKLMLLRNLLEENRFYWLYRLKFSSLRRYKWDIPRPKWLMVSLTNLLQSSSLTTSAAIIMTCFAPIYLAFSRIPLSLCSLRAINTRFTLLFAYSYAICCNWKQQLHNMIHTTMILFNTPAAVIKIFWCEVSFYSVHGSEFYR